MSNSVEGFKIWLESYNIREYLLGLLVLSSTFYLAVRVMYITFVAPPGTKVPRISLHHVFDFKRFRLRPWADVVDRIRASSESAGVKAAKHPLEPLFFVWDVSFVDYVVKNPASFPAHLIPPDNPKKSLVSSTFICGDHRQWREIRKVVKPLLEISWTPQHFHDTAQRILVKLDGTEGSVVPVQNVVQRCVAEGIYEVIFGIEPPKNYFEEGQEGYYYTESLEWVLEYSSNIRNWLGVNTVFPALRPGKREFYEHLTKLSKRIYENRDYWLKHVPDNGNLSQCMEIFPRLLDACDKGLLRDEAILMDIIFTFGAAQVSTSITIAVCLYYLSRDQKLQDAARAEINKTFDGELPQNSKDLNQLKIAQGAINEALRLAPPLNFTLGNIATKSCQIGSDIVLAAGSRIHCCLQVMHRDPDYFEDPNTFDPLRWITNDSRKSERMNRAFKPFGFGEPACPGRSLAMVELLTILAAILKNYRCRVSPDMDFKKVEDKFHRIHSVIPTVPDIGLLFEKI